MYRYGTHTCTCIICIMIVCSMFWRKTNQNHRVLLLLFFIIYFYLWCSILFYMYHVCVHVQYYILYFTRVYYMSQQWPTTFYTLEHCPISERNFLTILILIIWGCSPKLPLFEYKRDIILRNRHWHRFRTFIVVYFIFCFRKKIFFQSYNNTI